MGSTTSRSQAEHIASLIDKIENEHLKWYERQENIHYWVWILLEAVSVLAPAAATIVASLSMANGTFDSASTKGWLTSLPVVATVASSLLARLGAREMEQIREMGRQEVEYLLERTKLSLRTATTDEELIDLQSKLIEEIERIDVDQHRGHHRIAQLKKNAKTS